MKQYIQVSFKPDGPRYTYINEQPVELKAGDLVEIDGRYGPLELEVLSATEDLPPDVPSHITSFKHCTKIG